MQIFLWLLALLPGLLLSYYIFFADKYERESWWPMLLSFGLGVLTTYPVLHLQIYFDDLGFDGTGSLWQTFVYALVGVALTEEIFKFFGVMIFPFHRPFFNEPMDGIVFTVLAGMGFATTENILYAQNFGLETVLVRAFTAVPAHGVFGVIMGYFIGLAKFEIRLGRKIWLLLQGVLFAAALHAVYDFFILQEVYSGLTGLALLCLIIGIRIARHLINLHLAASPFKDAREENTLQP